MRRIKNIILILSVKVFLAPMIFSQQDPQFSHINSNLFINPGVAGLSDGIHTSAISRQQWIGLVDAPVISMLNIDIPVQYKGNDFGAGVSFLSEQIGIENNISVSISFSYKRNFWNGTLNFGLNGGIYQKKINGEGLVTPDELLQNINEDPLIPKSENKIIFDSGWGLFYRERNKFIGLSILHLNNGKFKSSETGNLFYSFTKHYYLIGGIKIQLDNPLFEIEPTTLIKMNRGIFQYDIGTNLIVKKKYWGGLSYRLNDAIILNGGTQLKNGIKIGIAYDLIVSQLRGKNEGARNSLEVMFEYVFDVKKEIKPKQYKSVRYL